MNANTMNAVQGVSPTVLVELGFVQRIAGFLPGDRRRIVKAIEWFEFKCAPKERKNRSSPVNESHRRKLRYIRASDHIRVVYAIEGADLDIRKWVWVGSTAELYMSAKKLDADTDAALQEIRAVTLEAMAGASEVTGDEVDVSPPESELKSLVNAVDGATLFVEDAKGACEKIVELLGRAKLARETAKREKEASSPDGPVVPLSAYNEIRAERDILLKRVTSAEKAAKSVSFNSMQVEQIRKMAAEENKTLRREADRLRSELAAAKAALDTSRAMDVLTDKAKEDLKVRCAKVCDDQANDPVQHRQAISGRSGRRTQANGHEDQGAQAMNWRGQDRMKRVADRISELVVSKTGMPLPQKATMSIAESASRGDEADRIAFEVCSTVCREQDLVIQQQDVAKAVRAVLKKVDVAEERRKRKLSEVRAAMNTGVHWKPLPSGASDQEALKILSGRIFATSHEEGLRTMSPKPIRHEDVCATCSRSNPTNISFLRYQAKAADVPREITQQMEETRAVVANRLEQLGVPCQLTISVVVHRGCCRVHGSEERRSGDGVAELPGVLMQADFGDGVVIEGEHEVRL